MASDQRQGRTFPFSAVVGQDHARAALLLATVDPAIGGVLLRGDKGSAKSTLARGLAALLPPGTAFVELPLGATEDRVLGSLDLHAALHAGEVEQFRPGLLAEAHGGVLYVDEVNLLADHLVDALLDAAASGVNRVERDGVSHEHAARFVLVGSMNPEEGELRPQLLDRFGLAVEVRTSDDPELRAEAVRRRLTFDAGTQVTEGVSWQQGDDELRRRLAGAEPAALSADVVRFAAHTAVQVGAESLRADLVLCRAAAALAGWEGRDHTSTDDVARVAPLVLSHRRRRRPFDPPTLSHDELAGALDRARATAEAAAAASPSSSGMATPVPAAAPAPAPQVPSTAGDLDDEDHEDEADDIAARAAADHEDRRGNDVHDDGDHPDDDRDADDRDIPDDVHDDDLDYDPSRDDDTQELLPQPITADIPRTASPTASGPATRPPAAPAATQRWQDLAGQALTAEPTPQVAAAAAVPAPHAAGIARPGRPAATRHEDARPRPTPLAPNDGGPRGRVVGDRPATADDTAADIAVVPTIRAALFRQAAEQASPAPDPDGTPAAETAPAFHPDDLRATQRSRRLGRTVVFALDTSGSMGTTERVTAAGGAILGLLADAYLRRDQVALVVFRGSGASEVLPPTGSIELARMRLGDLETGGATPLAEGIASALTVAQRVRSGGSEPLLVLLTDGRATGDSGALDHARSAASKVADIGVDCLVLDAEDGGEPLGLAKELAGLMAARYLPLTDITAPTVEIAVRNSL